MSKSERNQSRIVKPIPDSDQPFRATISEPEDRRRGRRWQWPEILRDGGRRRDDMGFVGGFYY